MRLFRLVECVGNPCWTMSKDMVATPIQYSNPWDTSMIRMILSILDDYHFPWLHEGILGTRDEVMPPKRTLTWQGNDLTSSFQTFQPRNVTNDLGSQQDGVVVRYEMIVNMPNIIRIIKENEGGGKYVVHFYPHPISYDKTGLFWKVTRNYDVGSDGDKRILDMEYFIQSQDKELIEKQKPWLLPHTPIKGADDALVAYLHGLKQFGISPRI